MVFSAISRVCSLEAGDDKDDLVGAGWEKKWLYASLCYIDAV